MQISDKLWTQIRNDNPDPEKYVPIVANGFEDLKARSSWQEEQLSAQKAKLAVSNFPFPYPVYLLIGIRGQSIWYDQKG